MSVRSCLDYYTLDNDRGGAKIEARGHVGVLGGLFGCNGGGCGRPKDMNLGATGLKISSHKNVYVVGVAAFRNTGYGIKIETLRDKNAKRGNCHGNVMLLYVAANENLNGGAKIESVGNVNVFRSMFNDNGFGKFVANGLDIHAHGDVFLAKVKANRNTGYGVKVDVHSKRGRRAITLLDVNVWRNDKGGAYVSNASFGRSRSRCNCNYGGVFIINSNFSRNGGTGLKVFSSQPVTLRNVNAKYNAHNGAKIVTFGPRSNVRVVNSHFEGNINKGLAVFSTGNVTLKGVTANSNLWGGAKIYAMGNVRVIRSQFNCNGGMCEKGLKPAPANGLKIKALGNVTLINVVANRNTKYGIKIDTMLGKRSRRGESLGNVMMKFVMASNNYRGGAKIDARGNVLVFGGLFSCNGGNCGPIGPKGPVIAKVLGGGRSGATGLKITSRGNVVLIGVAANRNTGKGIKIETLPRKGKTLGRG